MEIGTGVAATGAIVVTGLVFVVIPAALFIAEFFLARKSEKAALILPAATACFAVVLGVYPLVLAAVQLVIYFIMDRRNKKRQKQLSELEKMNLDDL